MNNLLKYLHGDKVIWIITFLLLLLSLVTVYSFVPILVKMEGGTPFKYLFKHLIYISIACVCTFVVHRLDPSFFAKRSKWLYYFGIALLVFTMLFGIEVNGAGRWVPIPFVGLTFQSSDYAKLAVIIYLSRLLVKRKDKFDEWSMEGFLSVITPPAIGAILIFRDNFSTAAMLFMVCCILMFIAQVPLKKMLSIFAMVVLGLGMIYAVHKAVPGMKILSRFDTWENRILNRFGNEETANGLGNLQARNAEQAIYAGGWFGQGIGKGRVKEFIPEAYADYYFASLVEETGFVFSFLLMFLYVVLLYRIFRVGLNANSPFESYVCFGIGILLLSQATVNMMVCTGIFPVTGQNLPLLAMGGSAMIMAGVSIGIVQSIAANSAKSKSLGGNKDKEENELEEE